MSIEVGQQIPDGKLTECIEFDPQNGCPMNPSPMDVREMAKGKTIVLFTVPGAFTPLCSSQHLPGFVEHAEALKTAGTDEVWCLAVNDAFVMAAWGREQKASGKVRMMADGSAEYTKALGLDRDLTGGGMGVRAFRAAMIITDGIVKYIGIEGSGEFEKSKAETILEELKK